MENNALGEVKTMLVPLDEEVSLLHASDILEPLSDEELEQLARNSPDVRLEEGEILFGPEEAGERLFIVKEGHIRLYKVGPEGQEMTLALMDQGRILGEMTLTAQRTRESYAQAAQPSLLISLSEGSFKESAFKRSDAGQA
jgi:CRP/FNR family cyclic AMP-dependent transcriptional regulator